MLGDDMEDLRIATFGVAHVHSARRFPASRIVRGFVPRELRSHSVAPRLSGESSVSPFRESDTALVSESCGGHFPITHPSGESDRTSKVAVAVSELASTGFPGFPFTYQVVSGNRR